MSEPLWIDSVPVDRSDCIVWSSDARLVSCSEPCVCTVYGTPFFADDARFCSLMVTTVAAEHGILGTRLL
jgi:hypothetical protein